MRMPAGVSKLGKAARADGEDFRLVRTRVVGSNEVRGPVAALRAGV